MKMTIQKIGVRKAPGSGNINPNYFPTINGKELAKIEKLMELQANCVSALKDLTVWLATFARGECRAHDVFESKRDAIAALTALNKFKIDRAKG